MANIALNGQPGFVALESDHYDGSGYNSTQAFRGVNTNDPRWNSASLGSPVASGGWIGCDFGSDKTIEGIRVVQFPQDLSFYKIAQEFVLEKATNSTFTTGVTVVHTLTNQHLQAGLDSGLVTFTPSTGRYWRIRATVDSSTGSNNGWGINVLELYDSAAAPPSSANLALNSRPSFVPYSIHDHPGSTYQKQNAFDANDATYWNSLVSSGIIVGDWIGGDLGGVFTITGVRVRQNTSQSHATQWVLEKADDSAFSVNLTTVYTSTVGSVVDTTLLPVTETEGQYWRIRCLSSSGSYNGWAVYSLEIHGYQPDPSEVTLDLLTDADVIFSPTILQEQVVTLDLHSDADTIFSPTVVTEDAIALPLVTDSDGILPPTVLVVQQIDLPYASDLEIIFAPTVYTPEPQDVDAPFVDEVDVILAPSVQGTPATLSLDFVSESSVVYSPFVFVEPFPITVRGHTRVLGGLEDEGEIRFEIEQTIEIRGEFKDGAGNVADPVSCTLQVQSPDGVETTYTFGTNAELERLGEGDYRVRIFPDQDGRWFYRWEGVSNQFAAADEKFFIISKTEFGV